MKATHASHEMESHEKQSSNLYFFHQNAHRFVEHRKFIGEFDKCCGFVFRGPMLKGIDKINVEVWINDRLKDQGMQVNSFKY